LEGLPDEFLDKPFDESYCDTHVIPSVKEHTADNQVVQQELGGLLDDLDDLLDDFLDDDELIKPSPAPSTGQEDPIMTVNPPAKEHTIDDQVLSFGKHAYTPPSGETMLCSVPECDDDFRGWRVKPKGTVSSEKQHLVDGWNVAYDGVPCWSTSDEVQVVPHENTIVEFDGHLSAHESIACHTAPRGKVGLTPSKWQVVEAIWKKHCDHTATVDDIPESNQANQKVHFHALKETRLFEVSKDERNGKKRAWLLISGGVDRNTDKMHDHWRHSGRNSIHWFHESKRVEMCLEVDAWMVDQQARMAQQGFHKAAMAELMDSTKHSQWDLPFGGSSKAAGGWKSTVNSMVVWFVS